MGRRLDVLDSLRGIAAFEVLVHHCLIAFPVFWAAIFLEPISSQTVRWLSFSPLHFFWEGQEAVIFFFVLSGFVLALPYVEDRAPRYGPYLLRRFCRIYLPFAAVSLISLVLVETGAGKWGILGLSPLLNGMWKQPVDAGFVCNVFFLTGKLQKLVPTAWSLVHEIRLSILFPLVGAIVTRDKPREAFLLSCLLAAWGGGLCGLGVSGWWHLNETVFYSAFFIWGGLLARYRSEAVKMIRGLGMGWRAAFALMAFAFYGFKWLFVGTGLIAIGQPYLLSFIAGLGALMIMMMALGLKSWDRFLRQPALLWLGKISYSLYLVHPMILLLSVYYLWPRLSLPGSVAAGFGLSLIFAAIFNRWVELPSIQLGRRLSR